MMVRRDAVPTHSTAVRAPKTPTVDAESVRDALHVLRVGRPVYDNPLAGLAIVGRQLRDAGLAPSPAGLGWALGAVLSDTVDDALAGARASAPVVTSTRVVGGGSVLHDDFRSGSADREAWSALYYRYLAAAPLTVGEIVRAAGVPRRTLARRFDLGYRLLADRLRTLEVLARHDRQVPAEDLRRQTSRHRPPPLASASTPRQREPSGLEEATLLVAMMLEAPDAFRAAIDQLNLPLAARCAADPAVVAQLAPAALSALRGALVRSARSPDRDVHQRIAAGDALGLVGDPRYRAARGATGAFLEPPLVHVPGGRYRIGADDGPDPYAAPRHHVLLCHFAIGRFPVTCAEWSHFVAAGGYDDGRWWDTPYAAAWQRGDGTAAGIRSFVRYWTAHFAADPDAIDERLGAGELSSEQAARWRARIAMDVAGLGAYLANTFPDGRLTEPLNWSRQLEFPLRPVVGISWYEARAFCAWLAHQTSRPFRLLSEVEWEAAAAGSACRTYAPGATLSYEAGNTLELHLGALSPIGVFPAGETPAGVSDLVGNARTWVSTLWGADTNGPPDFPYPYLPFDGREADDAPAHWCRLTRGSSFLEARRVARCTTRIVSEHPAIRVMAVGLRVAEGEAPDSRSP